MTVAADLPVLYFLDEVSRRTGISLRVLQDGCQQRNRKFDHVRIGKAPQMTEEQVRLLIERRTVAAKETDELASVRARVARSESRPVPRQRRARGAA